MTLPVKLASVFLVLLLMLALGTPLLVQMSWSTTELPVLSERDLPHHARTSHKTLLPLYKWSPFRVNAEESLLKPSFRHPLGTDILGRDQLARLILGAHVSILVGLFATLVSLLIGIPLGAYSGYAGGLADRLFGRFVEGFYALPLFFLLVMVAGLFRLNIWSLSLVLGIMGWVVPARYMRNEALRLKQLDFVRYSYATGAPFTHLLRFHLIPNGIAPVMVSATFNMANLILVEATLSFLGLGVQPPVPSWGGMIMDGMRAARVAPWLLIPPVLMVFFAIFSYDILGQWLKLKLQSRGDTVQST